jgi:hypothetical protein
MNYVVKIGQILSIEKLPTLTPLQLNVHCNFNRLHLTKKLMLKVIHFNLDRPFMLIVFNNLMDLLVIFVFNKKYLIFLFAT